MTVRDDRPGSFWSRRRAQVAAEEAAEARAAEAEAQAAERVQAEERPDHEILAELDLPAPEDMQTPDQVQALLKAAVPQRLKTRALRRLWRLNPVLANVDGLVDYGDDFTDAALAVEAVQTLYQVGKGMFDRAAEGTEVDDADIVDRSEKEPDDEAPDQVRRAESPVPEAAETSHAETPAEAPEARATAGDTPEVQPAAPRRMRFRFETAT